MNRIITESGMDFIADNIFHIEKTGTYKVLGDSVKTVEFIRAINDKLFFIEAKSSFPNPNSQKPNPEKNDKTGSELFREEVADVCDKFIHSLNHYAAIDVGVIGDDFPPEYTPPDKVSLVFTFVINGFEKSWCPAIKKAITNRIRESIPITKIWNPDIIVINDKIAKDRKLIS